MYAFILLMCVALVCSIPCRPRDPERRKNEGFYYYFNTTAAAPGDPLTSRKPVAIRTLTPRKKKCAPYEYNDTICEYIDDRELCGYNKNPQRVESRTDSKVLYNGCRLRDGRVECGYYGPFDNLRRPPAGR